MRRINPHKEKRVSILELDRELDFEKVISNLKLNYDKPIQYLSGKHNLTHEEMTAMNGWKSKDNNDIYTVEHMNIADKVINYIVAIGYYENPLPEAKCVFLKAGNEVILQKNDRVTKQFVKVIFFDIDTKLYAIIEATKTQEDKVKSLLFGQGYALNKKEEWGKISKENLQFHWESDFFYWLLSKVGSTFNIETDSRYSIDIQDIFAVAHATAQDEYNSTSDGSNILGSVSALSGFGTNQNLYEAGIVFKFPNLHLVIKISEKSTCLLDLDDSYLIIPGEPAKKLTEDNTLVLITIYSILLPILKQNYNKETYTEPKIWTTEQSEIARKNWAFSAIVELCGDNDIYFEDLEPYINRRVSITNDVIQKITQ